jgi:hypothetical protein
VPKDIMAEAGASCPDCHMDKDKKVVRPDAGACVACHDEKYRVTFEEWRTGIRDRVERIRTGLHALYKQKLTDAEKAVLAEIEKALGTVSLDGSSGVHNYMFLDDDLAGAEAKLKSLSGGRGGGA